MCVGDGDLEGYLLWSAVVFMSNGHMSPVNGVPGILSEPAWLVEGMAGVVVIWEVFPEVVLAGQCDFGMKRWTKGRVEKGKGREDRRQGTGERELHR